jgi:hypothetical protein
MRIQDPFRKIMDSWRFNSFRSHIYCNNPFTKHELVFMPSIDILQRPMQPLQDQLHSSNYELFEKDPVKYV